MSLFRSFLYLWPQLWDALWHRPQTVAYPFAPPQLPAGFRGHVVINAENCRGCSMCVRDCPAAALELERQGKDKYRLIYHPERCAYCGQCEVSCNFDAIHLSNAFVKGATDQDTFKIILVDRY
ncbi:MAG: 4Fe-4S dicluster domain-containing protein [Anaerolineae bacterium]|nr:4Fe-4S dicluster domain-containing protein [Anaerolineae bacterium]